MKYTDEEFMKTDTYQKYSRENQGNGVLKVHVFLAGEAISLKGVEVVVTKDIDGQKVEFFRGTANESGIIDDIVLPAPPVDQEKDHQNYSVPYATYNVLANSPTYHLKKEYLISIFDGIKSIQSVQMKPNGVSNNGS